MTCTVTSLETFSSLPDNEPYLEETINVAFAHSEGSGQPINFLRLIRVCAMCLLDTLSLILLSCGQ